jgi:hypothetical protein
VAHIRVIRYARNLENGLSRFLRDRRLAIHNNVSERELRREALGRKNEYLADVLARVQDQPTSAIDELLPGAWTAARDE